ncbi:MAG: rRNA pseudouridine synthase [Clostridia bacterium]|nr:rRNA pseudouridine synthase [Clostridia bacterium]
MRINKYIAQAGVASRRKADELIASGKVKVNGSVMDVPGYDVQDGDIVTVEGKTIAEKEKPVYYLLNKPLGYITSVSDDRERLTVVDLMTDVTARVFPVGRLDYNTSGILIMTNDGDFAYHVSHPKHEIYKTYRARVNGVFSEEKARKLRKGVDVGPYVTKPAKVEIVKWDKGTTTVEVSICEGKNHEVRDMFKTLGNPVLELERIAIGNIKIGRLLTGHYRKLTREEIEYLRNA